jgi:hypothetical protein
MKSGQITLPTHCGKCGTSLYEGFARCQNPACGAIREQFKDFERLIVPEKGHCLLSGAPADIRLPNGDYFWAPYFIDYLERGLINPDLSYSSKFYEKFPHLRGPEEQL